MRAYFVKQVEETYTQYATYLVGCFVFSIGAKFFIDSNLGTDPLDVLCIGMTKHLPITIGIASGIIAFIFLATWSLLNRKRGLQYFPAKISSQFRRFFLWIK